MDRTDPGNEDPLNGSTGAALGNTSIDVVGLPGSAWADPSTDYSNDPGTEAAFAEPGSYGSNEAGDDPCSTVDAWNHAGSTSAGSV